MHIRRSKLARLRPLAFLLLAVVVPACRCSSCDSKPTPPPSSKAASPAPVRSTAIDQQELLVPEEEVPEAVDAAVPLQTKRSKAAVRPSQCAGEISTAAARQVIDANRSQVRACYERQLRVNNQLAGDLLVGLRVTISGKVDEVRITGSLRDPQVHSCITALAKKWRFPSPEGDKCAVLSAPFHFEPQGAS